MIGQRALEFVIDKYGLKYYWWFWPAFIAIMIALAVLVFVLHRNRERLKREHPELFPEPPPRDSWL